MNKLQQQALVRLWLRDPQTDATVPTWRSYLKFRRRAWYDHAMKCWLTTWCSMLVGIESDGYTHT